MSKLTLILDSSQLAQAMSCYQQWAYSNVNRITIYESGKEANRAMNMGSFGHKLMEIYYKDPFGTGFEQAMDYAPNGFVAEIADGKEVLVANEQEAQTLPGVHLIQPFDLPKEDIEIVRARWFDYFGTISARNRELDIKPTSPDHVEVGFSEVIYEDEAYLFVLEGKIDVRGEIQGIPIIMDHKFQLRKTDIYAKTIQFRNYAMIGRVNQLLVNYVRLTKKVDADTFDRKISVFSPVEHQVWRQRLINEYFKIAAMIEKETFVKNWSNCQGKYGTICQYTPLCEEWDGKLVQLKIAQNYHPKQEWKPWQ